MGGKKIKKKKGKKEKKEKRKLKKKKRRESLAQQQQLEQEQALQQVQPLQGEDQGVGDRQAAFGSPLSSDPDFKQSPVVGCNRRRVEESNGDMAKAAKQSHRPSGPHTPPPPPPARRPPRTPPEPPMEDGDNSPGTPVYNTFSQMVDCLVDKFGAASSTLSSHHTWGQTTNTFTGPGGSQYDNHAARSISVLFNSL